MINRAIINAEQSSADEPPIATISWADHHPGDSIEQSIRDTIHTMTDLTHIYTTDCVAIFLAWNGKAGFTVVLNTINDDIYKLEEEAYKWVRYVTVFTDAVTVTDADPSVIRHEITDEPDEFPMHITKSWFKTSLHGGTLEFNRSGPQFAFKVANLFGYFPWSLFFISGGSCTQKQIRLTFEPSVSEDTDVEEYYTRIAGEFDEEFWKTIYHFIEVIKHQPLEVKKQLWFTYLQASNDFTQFDKDVVDQVSIMIKHQDILGDLPSEFFHTFIEQFLSKLSIQTSTFGLCRMLLQLSDVLLEKGYTDLAKLTEATVLEHSLVLEDIEQQQEILLALTTRSSRWGKEHLIAFVQSLIGIFDDNDDKSTLSKVINEVENNLSSSWDGVIALVDLSTKIENFDQAVDLRFNASLHIQDPQARADDIHAACLWALEAGVPVSSLEPIAAAKLAYAFEFSESSILLEQIQLIFQNCINLGRIEFLTFYMKQIRKKVIDQTIELPMEMLDDLQPQLQEPQYLEIFIEFLLIRLHVAYHQGNEEAMFQYTTQVFNRINPSTDEGRKTLKYVTQEIFTFATSIRYWPLIEEANRRFGLMVQDETLRRDILKSSYEMSLTYYFETLQSAANHHQIGKKLFDAMLANSNIVNDYPIILPVLPKLKKLSRKLADYDGFSQLLILEIKLNKTLGNEWISSLLKDLKFLVEKQEYAHIVNVFRECSKLDLTQEEAYELLNRELELAELDSDFLSSTEIFDKRLQLISLSSANNHEENLLNYRQGISELITKGDSLRVNQFALNALTYCQQEQLPEKTEFIDILQDNFKNLVQEYTETPSPDNYLILLNFYRQAFEKFQTNNQSIPFTHAKLMIAANIGLHQKTGKNQYLRRILLQYKEMGLITNRLESPVPEGVIAKFLEVYDESFNYIIEVKQDFGIVEFILDSAKLMVSLKQYALLVKQLDKALHRFKKEIGVDYEAVSAVVVLLYLISEIYMQTDADLNDDLTTLLADRAQKVVGLALSFPLSKQSKIHFKQLKKTLSSQPHSALQELTFSMEMYLQDLDYKLVSSF